MNSSLRPGTSQNFVYFENETKQKSTNKKRK